MNCENCYHYNACDMFRYDTSNNVPYKEDAEKYCSNFKDSLMIVELPCKIGDAIYTFTSKCSERDRSIQCWKYNHCSLCNLNKEYIVKEKTATDVLIYSMILEQNKEHKTIFLTREEAEKELPNYVPQGIVVST